MTTEQEHIINDIFEMLTNSENSEQSIHQIVRMITERFSIDVCSIYVYDPSENKLVLKATKGLQTESTDIIEMGVNEGLTGLVIETMEPIFVTHPATHPRFKFYEKSGEEKFLTYLGLPLIFHQKVLGALVIQTVAANGISKNDIPIFSNIAGQISAIVAYTGLLREDHTGKGDASSDTGTPQDPVDPGFLRGEGVSQHVASGFAYYLPTDIQFDQVLPGKNTNPKKEEIRLRSAFEKAVIDIKKVARRSIGLSEQENAIIDVQLMLLDDPSLRQKIVNSIREGNCAEFALKKVIMKQVEQFEAMEDPYLSERSADILDTGHRVLANLLGIGKIGHEGFARETIVVASDISPVKLLALRQPNLKGIVLAKGGRTSHTVIMARSMEIPIVVSVDGILEKMHHGDYVIVDGVSGCIYPNPSQQIRDEYVQREGRAKRELEKLLGLKHLPAKTRDGYHMRLGANIGLLSDVRLALKYGADHIGLYRTEFPFLLRKTFPTEQEQVALYRKVLTSADGRPVTIRTFDVGGDKFLPYLDYPREDNPFLGWRSIRISLDFEEQFRIQIRSILRASDLGNAKILFPMITGIEEIKRINELIDAEKELMRRKNIAFDAEIPAGIMVEVPAVIPILDRMLKYVDFVSIGTNDLMQYLLAVDRNNKKVAKRYNALHPSVISVIHTIVTACRENHKHVDICGEAASDPACALLYMGMGADHISMNASAIPAIKNFIRNRNRKEAKDTLREVLQMEDAQTVSRHMDRLLSGAVSQQPI